MPCTFPITHTYHFNVKMNDMNRQIWGMKTCLSMTKMCDMLAIHKQESVFQIMVKVCVHNFQALSRELKSDDTISSLSFIPGHRQ